MRVLKRPFVSYNEIQNFESCTQSGHSFFYREIQNFAVVPKRPFVFLQRNTEF